MLIITEASNAVHIANIPNGFYTIKYRTLGIGALWTNIVYNLEFIYNAHAFWEVFWLLYRLKWLSDWSRRNCDNDRNTRGDKDKLPVSPIKRIKKGDVTFVRKSGDTRDKQEEMQVKLNSIIVN